MKLAPFSSVIRYRGITVTTLDGVKHTGRQLRLDPDHVRVYEGSTFLIFPATKSRELKFGTADDIFTTLSKAHSSPYSHSPSAAPNCPRVGSAWRSRLFGHRRCWPIPQRVPRCFSWPTLWPSSSPRKSTRSSISRRLFGPYPIAVECSFVCNPVILDMRRRPGQHWKSVRIIQTSYGFKRHVPLRNRDVATPRIGSSRLTRRSSHHRQVRRQTRDRDSRSN